MKLAIMTPIISSISATIALVLPGRVLAEGSAEGEEMVILIVIPAGDTGCRRHSGDMDEKRLTAMVNERLERKQAAADVAARP
jgi:hypothetical protein